MGKIIVIGSASTDYTACVKSLPRPGETVGGAQFLQANGGKGSLIVGIVTASKKKE